MACLMSVYSLKLINIMRAADYIIIDIGVLLK